jgi:hypothetical protein
MKRSKPDPAADMYEPYIGALIAAFAVAAPLAVIFLW